MDAVSMYTNIDTKHAISVITKYLQSTEQIVNVDALINGLTILMEHNIFQFGDTHFVQLTGTAMGTPPAPPYATLYFYIHEQSILPMFPEIIAYGRLIDDGLGLWCPMEQNSDDEDCRRFELFQEQIQSFGILQWEFSDRTLSTEFLELELNIDKNGALSTRLYEKALNLYLYLPPHSAHPPGVLKGLIYGRIFQIFDLTMKETDRTDLVQALFRRLCARGYSAAWLRPLFYSSLHSVCAKTINQKNNERPIFAHIDYHPCDPPSSQLQQIFNRTIRQPKNERPINFLRNSSGHMMDFDRLIIAYHRPKNLRNLLAPRRFRTHSDAPVSAFISDETGGVRLPYPTIPPF
jgi:hypothetical protein